MEKNFWLDKWNRNDIGFHESDINPSLVAFFPKLKEGNTVLVPLCGKTKDMDWLAGQGYKVIGVELSEKACTEFFAERNVTPNISNEKNVKCFEFGNIKLLCGDFFEMEKILFRDVKAIYDCKAMIALPEEMRKKYVTHIKEIIQDSFQILLLVLESNDNGKGPPFSINEAEIKKLYGESFSVRKLQSNVMDSVPERLQKKGYFTLQESVYLLSN